MSGPSDQRYFEPWFVDDGNFNFRRAALERQRQDRH